MTTNQVREEKLKSCHSKHFNILKRLAGIIAEEIVIAEKT